MTIWPVSFNCDARPPCYQVEIYDNHNVHVILRSTDLDVVQMLTHQVAWLARESQPKIDDEIREMFLKFSLENENTAPAK